MGLHSPQAGVQPFCKLTPGGRSDALSSNLPSVSASSLSSPLSGVFKCPGVIIKRHCDFPDKTKALWGMGDWKKKYKIKKGEQSTFSPDESSCPERNLPSCCSAITGGGGGQFNNDIRPLNTLWGQHCHSTGIG